VTNSRDFIDSTATRTSRAYTTQLRSTSTMTRLIRLGPSSAMKAIAMSRYGSESCASTRLMMTASIRPPAQPLIRPSVTPTAAASSTEASARSSEVRAPYTIRLSTSRPRASVPNTFPPRAAGSDRRLQREREILIVVPVRRDHVGEHRDRERDREDREAAPDQPAQPPARRGRGSAGAAIGRSRHRHADPLVASRRRHRHALLIRGSRTV
jgi:hypothetical protein